MSSPADGARPGSGADPAPRHDDIEELLGLYVERLNGGDPVDLQAIRRDHPTAAEELIEHLQLFHGIQDGTGASPPVRTLGDYTLRRRLGRGGMGVVYEAWQGSVDRLVALKVLPPATAADPRLVARFVQEAKTAAQLNHPNIVAVHGMGVEGETPYFAMELVEGETVAQRLRGLRIEDVDQPFCLRLAEAFAGVADGLQHAHARRIIHRDIKPSNLIFDGPDRLRILDFGLARLEGREAITVSGDVLGTPQYMSPEQARRTRIVVDHRTDLYSLGATLYEALTLRPPFRGKDHQDTLTQIIERDPMPLRQLSSRVPVDLETIVLKCLRKDAADRYATAEALAQDLRRCVRGDAVEARPEAPWARWRRWLARNRWRLAAAAAAALLLAAAVGQGLRWHEDRRLRLEAEYEARVRGAALQLELSPVEQKAGAEEAAVLWPMEGTLVMASGEPGPLDRARAELEAAVALRLEKPDAWYHLARALLFAERWREADAALDVASPPGRPFVPALTLKARLLERRGDAAAAAALREAAARAAQAPWEQAWLEVARCWSEGKLDQAIAAYGKLIDLSSTREPFVGCSLVAHLGRGAAATAAGDHAQALRDFAIARTLAPGAIEPAILEARTWHLAGKPEIAARLFGEIHASAERKDEAAILIGALLGQLGDGAQRLAWAARVVEPARREAVRARCLFDSGDWLAAKAAARRAIELDPRSVDAYITLWWIHEAEGDRQAQVEALERGVQAVPDSQPLLHDLGNALRASGRPRQALAYYERASRSADRPGLEAAYMAACYLQLGEDALAGEWVQRAREAMDPASSNCGPWVNLGIGLYQAGRLDEAIDACDQAIRICGGWAWVHANRGLMLLLAGKLDAALEAFHRAQGLGPRSRPAFLSAATVHELRNDPALAASEILKLLAEEPELPGAHGQLVHLLRASREAMPAEALQAAAAALAALEEKSRGNPRLCNTLALVLGSLSGPEWRGQAIAAALRGLDAAEASGDFLKGLTRTLCELVTTAGASEPDEQLELPSLPPYAAIDACCVRVAATRAGAGTAVTTRRQRYLEGVLLERAGRSAESAALLRGVAAEEEATAEPRPEPVLALARVLRGQGALDEAQLVLVTALEARASASREIWEAWLDLLLNGRQLSPAQVLAAFPASPPAASFPAAAIRNSRPTDFAADARWLLERLAAGEAIRIDCGGAEDVRADGTVWSRDRFALGGSEARLEEVEIHATDSDRLYWTWREFNFGVEEALRGYRVPLPTGRYRVRLHVAETTLNHARLGPFEVELEPGGQRREIDPFRAAGFRRPLVEAFEVALEGGPLEIRFGLRCEPAAVAALEIERAE